eukprot:scaffold73843_cov32-Phaeocystis_antarctica.AAC.1
MYASQQGSRAPAARLRATARGKKTGQLRLIAQTWKFTRMCHYTSMGGESRASPRAPSLP